VNDKVRGVVITGPNTGGKTATLKALGLSVLMAQAGLYIPCSPPAILPPFSGVFADIGDEQSLSASLSTFSGHLTRIQSIRRESDARSLVLLDELGTGTDPEEGSALGVALVQRFVDGGPGGAGLVMATTHMGLLAGLKYQDERFDNVAVEFDEERLAPTYRLLWGVPGKSNAVHIAERLGLDAAVVEGARGRLGSSASSVLKLTTDLELVRIRQQEDEAERIELERGSRKLRSQVQAVEASSKVLDAEIAEARKRMMRGALGQARGELKKVLYEQRQRRGGGGGGGTHTDGDIGDDDDDDNGMKASALVASQLQGPGMSDIRARGGGGKPDQAAQPWIPQIGDKVEVPKLRGKGEIIGVKSNGKLTVKVGLMTATVNVSEVRR